MTHAPHQTSGLVGLGQRSATPLPDALPAPLRLGGRALPAVGTARVYVCGITPYDVTHLGHAATFVWADVLARVLAAGGARVETCRNVTDVDDVLTAAAQQRGRAYDQHALLQQHRFDTDMLALGVARPRHEPHARHHVGAVQQLAAALLATDAAYLRDGHVWFRGADVVEGSDPARARELLEQRGDEPDHAGKEHWADVAVWRPSGADDPAWPSSWGWGRPGWHAECAAMALATVGSAVDVLAGGEDLAFPHHAYQQAMVQAATGVSPFARGLLHVGVVHLDGAPMAKSTRNLVLVEDVLAGHDAAAVRLMLLDRRHHQAWDYTPDLLDSARDRLERLHAAAARRSDDGAGDVLAALRDDLDVPRALDLAERRGGSAARTLLSLLGLS